jgi:hypothetical protein
LEVTQCDIIISISKMDNRLVDPSGLDKNDDAAIAKAKVLA